MDVTGKTIRLMFQDEGRFGRITDLKSCWAPPGIRPVVHRQHIREFTYAYAAVSPADGVLDSLILPYANTDNMSIFLNEVSCRHPNDFIVMFADQASWHTSEELKIPENMKVCDILAYSPELNPVEHLWEEIREKWFPNYSSQKLSQVEDQLETALRTLENDKSKIQKMTGFEWINSVNLNAN